jgi:hypothetical protein
MQLAHYLRLLHEAQRRLADAFRTVAEAHGDEPDVRVTCTKLARECDAHAERLEPLARRYGEEHGEQEPESLHSDLFRGPRGGELGLLRDLHDVYLMATECDLVWTLVGQAAQGARDGQLLELVGQLEGETAIQLRWLQTRMKQAAPQALVVAP